jgi:hypothetical protein
MPMGASVPEIQDTVMLDLDRYNKAGGVDNEDTKLDSHGEEQKSKKLRLARGTAKLGINAARSFEKVKAKLGSDSAKDRRGAVQNKNERPVEGPSRFVARYKGDKGHIYIVSKQPKEQSVVLFMKGAIMTDAVNVEMVLPTNVDVLWSVPIADIEELRKHSGQGPRIPNSKVLVGWVMERQVRDSLEIVAVDGSTYMITAVSQRDHLFNRLCSMGPQRWEVC